MIIIMIVIIAEFPEKAAFFWTPGQNQHHHDPHDHRDHHNDCDHCHIYLNGRLLLDVKTEPAPCSS